MIPLLVIIMADAVMLDILTVYYCVLQLELTASNIMTSVMKTVMVMSLLRSKVLLSYSYLLQHRMLMRTRHLPHKESSPQWMMCQYVRLSKNIFSLFPVSKKDFQGNSCTLRSRLHLVTSCDYYLDCILIIFQPHAFTLGSQTRLWLVRLKSDYCVGWYMQTCSLRGNQLLTVKPVKTFHLQFILGSSVCLYFY